MSIESEQRRKDLEAQGITEDDQTASQLADLADNASPAASGGRAAPEGVLTMVGIVVAVVILLGIAVLVGSRFGL